MMLEQEFFFACRYLQRASRGKKCAKFRALSVVELQRVIRRNESKSSQNPFARLRLCYWTNNSVDTFLPLLVCALPESGP